MLVKVRRGIRDNFFQFLKKVGANSGRAPVREISSVYRCRHTDLHVGIAKRNNDRRFIARLHILESGDIITHILYLGPVPEARPRSPGVLCTSVNNCFEVLARLATSDKRALERCEIGICISSCHLKRL